MPFTRIKQSICKSEIAEERVGRVGLKVKPGIPHNMGKNILRANAQFLRRPSFGNLVNIYTVHLQIPQTNAPIIAPIQWIIHTSNYQEKPDGYSLFHYTSCRVSGQKVTCNTPGTCSELLTDCLSIYPHSQFWKSTKIEKTTCNIIQIPVSNICGLPKLALTLYRGTIGR